MTSPTTEVDEILKSQLNKTEYSPSYPDWLKELEKKSPLFANENSSEEEYWSWAFGLHRSLGIDTVVHKEDGIAKALAQHEVFKSVRLDLIREMQKYTQKDKISTFYLNGKKYMSNQIDDNFILALSTLLTQKGYGNNPKESSKHGWELHSVRTGSFISDLPRMSKDGVVYAQSLVKKTDESDFIRAAVGSFHFTYRINFIDMKKQKISVTFMAYNVVSNKSGSPFGVIPDNDNSKLHQFFIWNEVINFRI
jgi:hypothetical protein